MAGKTGPEHLFNAATEVETTGALMSSNITSPLLLIALAVFFGACYIMYLKTQQSQLVLLGATLVVIGSHAAFHELESVETDELQMEPV
ncbi:hypothetical protein Chor_005255 [Crotalus horridus]